MVQLLINATILNNPRQTGLGVYAASLLPFLLREMSESKEVDEIVVLGDMDCLGAVLGEAVRTRGVRIRAVPTNHPVRRLIDLTWAVRSEMRRGESTLLYSPTHHGVLLRGLTQIITVHDLFARLFPDNYPMQSWYFRWYMPRLLRKTCRVVVDSGCTASDLSRFYPHAPPTNVVYLGVRSDICEATLRPVEELQDVPYFLFIGPSYWYKNCERLIDAFADFAKSAASPMKLVFVGGQEPYRNVLRKHLYAKHAEVAEEVVFLDYVTDDELAWLYRNSVALMITTLWEGFGLPALEAMACDCPVVASRAGSLPEVCGQAAIFVDPKSIEEIVEAMTCLTTDPDTRKRLVVSGRSNWQRFRWDEAARQVCRVIGECLKAAHE